MDLIRITDVSKTYKSNGVVALYDLNLSIAKGEFVFVIGASGSGKSTLIKMLYREEKPDKGSIIIGGINVAKLKDRKVYMLRRKLGVVFQDFKLLPKLTVYENVAFAMEVFSYDKKKIHKRVMEVLDLVGLKQKVRDYPDHLSGGEQQRVVIARAIVNNPKIGWLSKLAVTKFVNRTNEYSQGDLDVALKIVEIATIQCYRDCDWAISIYENSKKQIETRERESKERISTRVRVTAQKRATTETVDRNIIF